MDIQVCKWDFFIAHAGADRNAAESLYALLAPHCRVFLDSRSLLPGDDWDQELPFAQKKSLITIVLVSLNTEKAYYQQEEIAGAIAMARTDKDKHRVVPVYLEDLSDMEAIPYGLRLKHGLRVSKGEGLLVVSKSLLELLNILEQRQNAVNKDAQAATNFTDGQHEHWTTQENQPGFTATSIGFTPPNRAAFRPGPPHTPDAYPTQQPQLQPYPSTNPQPSYPAPPAEFVLRCVFANDPNAYFVTSMHLIVAINSFGQVVTVGQRIPSMYPNFAWMYQTPNSTYGVTFQGYILCTFLNGQVLQIGYVTNAR